MILIKVVYLDQNKWIDFLEFKKGRKSTKELRETYEFINEVSNEDDIVFPISLSHLVESQSQMNLLDFMSKVCGGYTIRNCRSAEKIEIINYLGERTEVLPSLDLQECMVNKGFPYFIGDYALKKGEKYFQEEKIRKVIDSEETFKKLLRIVGSSNGFSNRNYEDKLAEDLEKLRNRADKINQTDEYRWISGIVSLFSTEIRPFLIRISNEFGINGAKLLDKDLLVDLPISGTYPVKTTFQKFPSFYCYYALTMRRDIRGCEIEGNMINDIEALSMAIPYSDILITEEFFTGIAKQENLHKIYGTKITTDLSDLKSFLQ